MPARRAAAVMPREPAAVAVTPAAAPAPAAAVMPAAAPGPAAAAEAPAARRARPPAAAPGPAEPKTAASTQDPVAPPALPLLGKLRPEQQRHELRQCLLVLPRRSERRSDLRRWFLRPVVQRRLPGVCRRLCRLPDSQRHHLRLLGPGLRRVGLRRRKSRLLRCLRFQHGPRDLRRLVYALPHDREQHRELRRPELRDHLQPLPPDLRGHLRPLRSQRAELQLLWNPVPGRELRRISACLLGAVCLQKFDRQLRHVVLTVPRAARQRDGDLQRELLRIRLQQRLRRLRRGLLRRLTRGRSPMSAGATSCPHFDGTTAEPRAAVCEGCGSTFNLRVCTTCGHVGCCNRRRGTTPNTPK